MTRELLFTLAGGGLIGAVCFWAIQWLFSSTTLSAARMQAEEIRETAREEAKALKQESQLAVDEETERKRKEFEKEFRQRRKEVDRLEERLLSKESRVNNRLNEISKRETRTREVLRTCEFREAELKRLTTDQRERLERISAYSAEQAKTDLLDQVHSECEKELALRYREFENRFQAMAQQRAVRILADAMCRCKVDLSLDPLVSIVRLPHDEMKGRIIGREGRNIRAFEHLAGVDVIVDDSPGIVVLSAFNPLKREMARMSMEKLVADGRIHPTKIEQALEQAQKDLQDSILESGEQAALKCGIHGLSDKLMMEIGKLRYKVSEGQNLLEHSMEVADIAGTLAAEIGADVMVCKRAGLLHDIGKLSESEDVLTHSRLGAEMARKHGEKEPVPSLIANHHDEINSDNVEQILLQIADRISAKRPGARKGELTTFVKRLAEMEAAAQDFPGVKTAFILQSGREIRVLVKPEEVSDSQNQKLAGEIARRLQSSVEYPGTVKVTVIREIRAMEIAK